MNRPTKPGFYWVENTDEIFPVEVEDRSEIYSTNKLGQLTILNFGDPRIWTFDEFEEKLGIIRWLKPCIFS